MPFIALLLLSCFDLKLARFRILICDPSATQSSVFLAMQQAELLDSIEWAWPCWSSSSSSCSPLARECRLIRLALGDGGSDEEEAAAFLDADGLKIACEESASSHECPEKSSIASIGRWREA